MTPIVTGVVKETQRKYYELLHFGFGAQLEPCREVKWSRQIYVHRDSSLARELFLQPRFIVVNSGHVLMLIKGYINHKLYGDMLTDLRMGVSRRP
jgi:hypothetical protein